MPRPSLLVILVGLALLAFTGRGQFVAAEEIPPQRARQIEAAAPAQPAAEPRKQRKVLIFNTPSHLMPKDPHKGYCIPYGTQAFVSLGEKSRAYQPMVSDDLAMLLPENITQFDGIVLNNTSGPWIKPTEEDLKREEFRRHGEDQQAVEGVLRESLLNWVRDGGGLAAIHFAIGANRHWPEFRQLLGAEYGGHPWNEEVQIHLDEPDHPLVAAFEGKDFRLAEEIYQFKDPYSRENLRVLLSLDTDKTNMEVPWIDRKDGDFALAWVRPFGKGRVFYTALGHRTELYWNPAILRFYLDGIQFAVGDLEAPMTPSEPTAEEGNEEEGFVSLFNGRDLSGWEGDESVWSVREGVIVGQTMDRSQLKVNSFLVWKDGQPRNFELRLKYKLVGGNSGIYFHSQKREEGEPLIGPQADFSADHRWTGVLMEWKLRDVLAERGEKVVIDEQGNRQVVGSVGNPDRLLKEVHDEDWNEYTVRVEGEKRLLKINGVLMSQVEDKDPNRPREGHLALQVHTGPPMKVEFKDIRIKILDE